MTLTTEQIEQVIDDCRKGAAMRGLFNKWIVEEMASELLRCRERFAELSAVANREAQPVAYLNKFSGVCMTLEQQPNAAHDAAVYVPLYLAPPAPAVNTAPDFEAWFNSPEAGLRVVNFHIQHELQMKAWEACRAAMLAQPVSQRYKLNYPEIPESWIACSERMPEFEDDYYLTYAGGVISVDCLIGMRFSDRYATHWMPLPAAPEGGNG